MSSLPCRNCGAPAAGKYCGECGQSTALHPPTAGEFLHEFVGHHVALEGKLWKTLGKLLFQPGSLTVEYFAGRKLRYVNPLRLYLSVSLILFAVLGLVNPKVNVVTYDPASRQMTAPLSHDETMRLAGESLEKFNFAPAWVKEHAAKFLALTGEQQGQRMSHAFTSYSPYAFFLLLPVLALLLKLFYLRRDLYYGEHLVCAFHLQTAWFIFELADVLVVQAAFGSVTELVITVYTALAVHRVYGGRWWATIMRVLALGLVYSMLLSIIVMCMLAVSVLV